jgi:predicted nucleotidyltransferase
MFGSTARGTDAPNSDIDLLVSLGDPSLERIVNLEAKLSALAGRHVDVVRLTDTQGEPGFLADAVRDGRVLVDREARWPHLRRREAALRRETRAAESGRVSAALLGVDRVLAG